MNKILKLISNRYVIWILFSIPGFIILAEFAERSIDHATVIHETGEFAVRFLVVTLLATPLSMMFPSAWITRWLVLNRRYLGVATFGYSLLHALFYLLEEGNLGEEFFRFGILTGWIAFFILVLLAMTSNDISMKELGPTWKKLQRWVYGAALLTLLHWVYVEVGRKEWVPAVLHFSPVIILSIYRIWKLYLSPQSRSRNTN